MPTATETETLIVTKDELVAMREAEAEYVKAKKKADASERLVKLLRLKLAEKVLGIKTEEDLKKLTPEKVQKLYAQRLTAGDWEPGRGAPTFVFANTSHGRYPAWAQIYEQKHGVTAADEIRNDTPESYSYRVEVAQKTA